MTCSQTNQLNGISIVVWSFLYIFKLFTIQSTSPCYCMFVWRTILLKFIALNFCVEKVLLTINPYHSSYDHLWMKNYHTQFCFDEQGLRFKEAILNLTGKTILEEKSSESLKWLNEPKPKKTTMISEICVSVNILCYWVKKSCTLYREVQNSIIALLMGCTYR